MQRKPDDVTHAIEVRGTVQKIIPASGDSPEMAQIFLACADGSYAEIRVKNSLQDKHGNLVALLKGAHVEITIKPDRRTKSANA